MNISDGWGQSQGISIETLGQYSTMDKAKEAKQKRDSDKNFTWHDICPSWIEEEKVQ